MSLAVNKGKHGGRRPGAGRPKGPAKSSVKFLATKVDHPDSVDSIRDYMRYCRSRARTEYLRRNPDHEEIAHWLKEAAIHAKDLLKFQHPALANTVLQGDTEKPLRHVVEVEFVGRKDEKPAETKQSPAAPASV